MPRTRAWFAHIALILVAEFAAESARGLVLPTLFSYAQRLGGGLEFVGLLTALFSAGRFVASLLFGWLSDRVSFRVLYVVSAGVAIVGNALYVLPYSPRVDSRVVLGVSRFVVGFGAGNRSVCRANVAALTRVDQRVSYFTLLATVVFLAYALTPGLGGVIGGGGGGEADSDVLVFGSEYVHFNRLTAPGFVLVCLNVVTMVVNIVVYDESVSRSDAPIAAVPTVDHRLPSGFSSRKPPSARQRMIGILVFIFVNVIARGILSIFETVNVPLYIKAVNTTISPSPVLVFKPFEWHSSQSIQRHRRLAIALHAPPDIITDASRFYLAVGLLGLVSYGAVHILGRRVSEVSLLLFGFASLLVGNALLVILSRLLGSDTCDSPIEFKLFVVAEILVWSVGCPIASAVIVPAFSNVLGSKPQGSLMGVFGAAASVSRMVMPLLPGLLPSWETLFDVNVLLCVGCVAVLLAYLVVVRNGTVQRSTGVRFDDDQLEDASPTSRTRLLASPTASTR